MYKKSQAKNVNTIILSIHNDQCNNYNNNNQTSSIDEDQCLQGTNEFLQSSLLTSLQSEFLPSSLLVPLQYGFLLLSLLVSLRCEFIQSSLLVSLQSIFILTSPLTPMRKTFLRRLYEYTPMVTPIPLKPEMFFQCIRRSVIIPEYVKPESPESWIPSRSSLQPYAQWFDKFVTYYMFDHDFIVDTCDIRRQLGRYIMAPKRKQRAKLKAEGCAEGHYYPMLNNMLESSSDLLQTKRHV